MYIYIYINIHIYVYTYMYVYLYVYIFMYITNCFGNVSLPIPDGASRGGSLSLGRMFILVVDR